MLKSRTSGALPLLCERSRRMFPQLEGLGLKVGKIGIAVAMEILHLLCWKCSVYFCTYSCLSSVSYCPFAEQHSCLHESPDSEVVS